MIYEEWKEIKEWDGKYKISSKGVVRNNYSNKEVKQVLTGIPQYKYVNLCTKDKKKLCRVHILVAKSFINPVEGCNIVDHIDRDKMNNDVTNLRWVDHRGNQRNREDSFYLGDVLLKDFIQRYDNHGAADSFIRARINSGMSCEESVESYEEYLTVGLNRRKVLWKGEEMFLTELCNSLNVSYSKVSINISSGMEIWNAVYDVPEKYTHSFEVLDVKGVGHWYKSGKSFELFHPTCTGQYKRLLNEGKNLTQILDYDGKDHLRQTVDGVNGTLEELCIHFNKSYSSISTRMYKGMSIEQAFLSPPKRVKKVNMDGVSGSPKYWYEYYGLEYCKVKKKKDVLKCSFEEILILFGVDLSDKVITYGD